VSSADRLDFGYLKSIVSLERVLAAKDLLGGFRTRGDSLVGPCPLHHGDNPQAFVVSRSKNLWYCFTRCQRGGDVVDFVRFLDGRSYRDTARWLASLVGEATAQIPAAVATFEPFTRSLRLDPDVPFLSQKGIQPATARQFEAGLYRGQGFLKGCTAIRLHDPSGLPLGYAGRRMDPDEARRHGKWKLPARLPKRTILFNFHRVCHRLEQGLVLVEDPWSVMRLAQLGIPAVALLGTALSDPQRTLLLPAPRLLLLLDGDAAGAAAATTLRAHLAPAEIGVAELPDNLDPDQLSDDELRAYAALFFRSTCRPNAHPA
jgi:DNA primase